MGPVRPFLPLFKVHFHKQTFIGFHGLIAAKTYLDVNPSASVVLYESASSVGGVWAKERLYPGISTNNLFGTYEFSDFPMDSETYDVRPGQHIPGTVVHRYLTNFAEHFGIYKLIRFNVKVESAEHQDGGGWLINSFKPYTGGNDERSQILAKKLIVATGLTEDPIVPELEGSETFDAPIFHSKYFAQHTESLQTAKRVTVLGGMKSAFDVAYTYASRGIQVDMIIRESGHGPLWSKYTSTLHIARYPSDRYQILKNYSCPSPRHAL